MKKQSAQKKCISKMTFGIKPRTVLSFMWAFQVVLVLKNLPASAGDIKDVGLIPRLGRSP